MAVEVAGRIAQRCWAVRARALGRLVSQIYDEALRPHGVKVSQVNLLAAIGASQPVAPTDLGKWMGMEKSTVSRNVEALRKQGWVEVEEAPAGRGRRLRLAEPGVELLAAIEPAWAVAQAELERVLGDRLDALEGMRRDLAGPVGD